MTTWYSRCGSPDVTNFAPEQYHIPEHTSLALSRIRPTRAQTPRLTVIYHNVTSVLFCMGIFRAQDSTKNQFRPFPHSPRESSVIHHPLINLPFLPSPFARGPVIAPLWISGNQDRELRPDISASFTKQNMWKEMNTIQCFAFKINHTTLLKTSIFLRFNI